MRLITYQRRAVAMAGTDRLYLAPHVDRLPDGHPLKTFVCFLALYARDVQTGALPDEPRRYLPRCAERYARAALMPAHDSGRIQRYTDRGLTEGFRVPVEQIARQGEDFAEPLTMAGTSPLSDDSVIIEEHRRRRTAPDIDRSRRRATVLRRAVCGVGPRVEQRPEMSSAFLLLRKLKPSAPRDSVQPMPRSSVSVADLLSEGLLRKGEQLTGRSRGSEVRARVQQDGRIKVEGADDLFSSLSLAGNAVTGRNTNGWTFWHVKRGAQNVSLAELRARLTR